jgi:glycosyltransferase involved in cell wall biosynthesis
MTVIRKGQVDSSYAPRPMGKSAAQNRAGGEGPAGPPPSISVLIPSLDAEEFVAAAIRSALDQPLPPLELIVQDGGSTDGTVEAVEAIDDPRVAIVSEQDEGQSDALNRALDRARGDWVVWLNADDLLAPGAFAEAAPLMSDDVDVVYGDFAYVNGRGEVTQRIPVPEVLDRDQLLVKGHYLFSGASLLRRSVFERFGDLDTALRMAMDYDLFLRIAPHVRAVHCGATLGYFRQHPGSRTAEITWRLVREEARVRRRHGGYATRRTAGPILLNEAKRVADVSSLPVRKALRRGDR